MKIMAKFLHREKAQGLVEFALVLPILLLVMFGIIELGRLFVIYSSVLTSSREAARYASAVGQPTSTAIYLDCPGIRNAASRMGVLVGIPADDITGTTDPGVKIEYDHGPNTTIFGTCPHGSAATVTANQVILGDRVKITVAAQYRPMMGLVKLPTFMITSQTARSIVKEIAIKGTPPPGFPTNTSTATKTSTATQTSTATNTSTATHTATFTWTPTITWTPTNTLSPTPGDSPTPTNTLVNTPANTATPTETGTATMTATNTSTATATSTPDPCVDLRYNNYSRAAGSNKIIWYITNNYTSFTFTLIRITIPWTQNSQKLTTISLGGQVLWQLLPEGDTDNNGGTSVAPAGYPAEYTWTINYPAFRLEVGPNHTEELQLLFLDVVNPVTNLTVAIFRNDTTGTDCPVSIYFY